MANSREAALPHVFLHKGITVSLCSGTLGSPSTPFKCPGTFKQGDYQTKHKSAKYVSQNRPQKGHLWTASELEPEGRVLLVEPQLSMCPSCSSHFLPLCASL